MMDFLILKDIVIIFGLSTLVNLLFTRLKIPTIVGYLITGILAGPHVFALVSGGHEIELMAEIGIVFLLFTIGLEFSLKHLVKIRKIVFWGGFMQVALTTIAFFIASYFYNIGWKGGLLIGFLAALSSSAIVLKMLQERSELTSNYGRTVLGILIFQDIMLVPLLLFVNLLGNNSLNLSTEIILLLVKTIFIIALVFIGNKWLIPKLLHLIALTKNQELFFMSIIFICLGIALLTSKLGMSLAFGAFLAGLMISESEYSHNIFGNIIPFKDTFTSFFFVSIGMLLDISFIVENYAIVLLSIFLIISIKTLIAGGTGFVLGHTFRGTVIVGLALCQVGEFSFILGKLAFNNGILTSYYYQLFLAVAVITMALTPFLIRFSNPVATLLLKLPVPQKLVDGLFPLPEIKIPQLQNHLVIIGKDPAAIKLSTMVKNCEMPHISIIFDPVIAREQMNIGDTVIYGDAVNDPILEKAHIDTAEIIVVSVGNYIPATLIIEKIRKQNKKAFLIVRTQSIKNVEQLYSLGADQVIAEKLEIAIDIFNRILINRKVPQKEINRMLSNLRNLNLGKSSTKDLINQPSIIDEFTNIDIHSFVVKEKSAFDNNSVQNIELRKKVGATLIAIKRNNELIEHPKPDFIIEQDDIVYLFGTQKQLHETELLFESVVAN